MFCKKCGAEILEGTSVCPNCGTLLDQKSEDSKTELQKEQNIQEKPVLQKEQEEIKGEQEKVQNNKKDIQGEQEDIGKEQILPNTEERSQTEEATDTQEDVLQFSNSGMKSGVTSYEEPIFPETPKKKGKGSIIAVCTLAGALVILVLYLVVSLLGKDNTRNYVKKAFANTAKSLLEANDTTAAQILLSDVYSQNMNLTVKKFEIEDYGEIFTLEEEARITFGGTVDNKNKTAFANIGFGYSDMNDIQMEMYFDKNKFYFGFPDLYDKFFLLTDDDLDLNMESMMQQQSEEALKSLAETLLKEFANLYKNIQFEKTDKVTLHGNSDIKTQEVIMSMKAKDYNQFLNRLPEIIENNVLFMDWLTSLTSEYEKEDFIEEFKEMIEEIKAEEEEDVKICYLYIDEKEKQIVGFRIPLDNPEEETVGQMVFCLLGEDKLTDYIEYNVDVTSYGYNTNVSLIDSKTEEGYNFSLTAAIDEEELFHIVCNYDNVNNQDSFVTNIKNLSFEFDDGYNTISILLDGSYETKKAEAFDVPSQNSADLMEMSDIEIQEAILTILQNILDKNYVPSFLKEDLRELIEELKENTSVGSDLDGSDNLTYEEFKQVVKEVYGDIYSEEELEELYQTLYEEDNMSDSEKLDNEIQFNGENVILSDYENQYFIEIIPPEGAKLEEDWVNFNQAYFEKDNLEYYYAISSYTEEDMKDYFNSTIDYYEGDEEVKLDISELQTKNINGYDVLYTILNVEYLDGTDGYSECAAYVRIDENYVLFLDITNGSGKFNEKILDDCFNSKIPVQ